MKHLLLILALLWGASVFAAPERDRDVGANSSLYANQTRVEDSALWRKFTDQFSLSYYVSMMGPTLNGPMNQTYNVFLDGRSPIQLFHGINLRWQFDPKWAVGFTAAGVQHITKSVTDKGVVNNNNSSMFNSRAYLATPPVELGPVATMFNTFAIEFPTTPGSVENEMKYGLVLSQSLTFKLPPSPLTAGWLTQLIRYKYRRATLPPPFIGGLPTPLQTTLITTGPYFNYQLAPQWQIASLLSFDWDQRGSQTDTLRFNNNLHDRVRLAINYFFQTKPFTHVGLYTQALTNYSQATTIIGLDFSLKF
ncbi:MAG: hypothetical protein K2P81_05325 [Bacteriovoracaceae bacterium]|nr:hypothetical protein [Bacteriovoracaceae bacterium]